jgi:hypothetical protein
MDLCTFIQSSYFLQYYVLVLRFNLNFIEDYRIPIYIYCVVNSHN